VPKLPRYVVILALLFCFPSMVLAKPMFAADLEGVRIVLTDDKCDLTVVANLPYKATWTEKGRTFTGCWGVMGQNVVAFFSEDKTVAAIPVQVFQKLQEV
jgi:hypothetical protein